MRGALAALALGAGLAAGGVAGAQEEFTDNRTMVPYFTLEELQSTFKSVGIASVQGQVGADGPAYLQAADPSSNLVFVAEPMACYDGRCVGLMLSAQFRGDLVTPEAVRQYDLGQPFIKAVMVAENTALIGRYEIADFGIPRGNIRASVANFLAIAAYFPEFARSSQTTASNELPANRLKGSSDVQSAALTTASIARSETAVPHARVESAVAGLPELANEF
ncbi:MAG: hypothetical protein HXY25_05860 [Alphaproteobacteria bacterium]|nr:hypothetical protein [Alphaproteobacteria bacterium]